MKLICVLILLFYVFGCGTPKSDFYGSFSKHAYIGAVKIKIKKNKKLSIHSHNIHCSIGKEKNHTIEKYYYHFVDSNFTRIAFWGDTLIIQGKDSLAFSDNPLSLLHRSKWYERISTLFFGHRESPF